MGLLINYRFLSLTALAAVGRLQGVMAPAALLVAGHASGLSAVQSSIIAGTGLLVSAFSATQKGKVTDQKGYRFVVNQSVGLGAAFAFTIIAFEFLPWIFAVIGAGLIGFTRINSGALQNSIWARYHKKDIMVQRALALENVISFTMQIIAPLIVGLCLLFAGGTTALLITAISASLSMFCWGMLAPDIKNQQANSISKNKKMPRGIMRLAFAALFVSASTGLLQGILLQTSGPKGAFMISVFTLGAAAASGFFLVCGFTCERFRKWTPIVAPVAFLPAFLLVETALVWPMLFVAGAAFSTAILSINTQVKEMISKNRFNEGFALTLTANITGSGLGILLSGLLLSGPWQPILLIILPLFVLINYILKRDPRLKNPYLEVASAKINN